MTRPSNDEIREAAMKKEYAQRWLSPAELGAFTALAREFSHGDGSISIELPNKTRYIVLRASVTCDVSSFNRGWNWMRYARNAFYGAILTRRSIIILDSYYADE